ncbi:HlyD family secretion protein [Azospirillum rugosum]|uniref:Membrane fusion protein (Multidrug efflux system) n=1 Tax=Azospirillum rugosum TaxID=416170 RepID=A0ABS4SN62_9PROT|nr:HlyD family secretion protein [Azospirillum rugosum]MBP2293362.1 membrane fusion protein (multidrug efflux system) [Azospirillum rugosum]
MVELTHDGRHGGTAEAPRTAVERTAIRRPALKRAALALVLLGGVAAAGFAGHRYWTVGRYLETTDDAYVKADHTVIAPKVSGYIAEVLVQDNERVTAGQPLARIDDRDFRVALDQAQADLEMAEAAISNLDAQIVLQRSLIEQEKADVAASEVALAFAQKDNARYSDLMQTGYGTTQRAQQAEATLGQAQAKLRGDRAALVAAQDRINVLATERGKAEAQRDRSRGALEQARLNLSYTVIAAPISGTVGARSLRVGQYVQTGTQLMAVVPLQAVYVVANFKETQLTHVHAGQPVEIAVDGFPGVELKGHVDGLSPASGLEFALLPPDNATGNFTKIVQRIPVKILLDPGPLSGLLRPGMSVEPTIDTRGTAGTRDAATSAN